MIASTIGLDLAKHNFHVHAVDAAGSVVRTAALRRGEMIKFFRNAKPCLVGMEACATAHYWARELMTRFIDDGRVEIDSNTVERSIRPIALNRKNALFAGSDAGAEHWATIASLIETAKLNGVEPMAYLTDVITKIVNGHPNSQIDDLLPWVYAEMPEAKAVV